MIQRRRELGIAQEDISAKHIWARGIITSLGITLLTTLIIGLVIFMSVHKSP